MHLRRVYILVVFLIQLMATKTSITSPPPPSSSSCSTWFDFSTEESLHENLVSFNATGGVAFSNKSNTGNFIGNLAEHESTSMEDMVEVLATLKFKNYRMVSTRQVSLTYFISILRCHS